MVLGIREFRPQGFACADNFTGSHSIAAVLLVYKPHLHAIAIDERGTQTHEQVATGAVVVGRCGCGIILLRGDLPGDTAIKVQGSFPAQALAPASFKGKTGIDIQSGGSFSYIDVGTAFVSNVAAQSDSTLNVQFESQIMTGS